MDDDTRQKNAVIRYGTIAPAVCHTLPEGTTLAAYFADAAQKSYPDASGKLHAYSEKTLERWYYFYLDGGFNALIRQPRCDQGKSRKIDSEIYEQIKCLKEKSPRIPSTEVLQQLIASGTIQKSDISLSTVTRCINQLVADQKIPVHADMKRYERPHINEVWYGDSCVAPKVMLEGAKRRIIIIALIDDASRYITGAIVSYHDDFNSLLPLMKSATMKFGIPKMFSFDNGRTYKSHQMELLSARIGTTIHHCQPYTPTQKAKIERWFRTLRDKWLAVVDLSVFNTLDEIQTSLDAFVNEYNRTPHSSLSGKSPDDRFFSEPACIRKMRPEDAEKAFLLEIDRRVSSDSVIVIDNTEYVVDSRYSGTRVRLRYSPDMSVIYLVEKEDSLIPIKILNKQENAFVKRNKLYLSGGTE